VERVFLDLLDRTTQEKPARVVEQQGRQFRAENYSRPDPRRERFRESGFSDKPCRNLFAAGEIVNQAYGRKGE